MCNPRAPMGRLRSLVVVASLLAWLLFAGLALHRSGDAVVLGRYSVGWARLLAVVFALSAALTLATRPRVLAWLVARRGELLLVPFAVACALLAGELWLRVFDPVGIAYYSEMRRYEHDRVADPLLHYRQPTSTTRRYQGVDFRYNELGLRDDPIGAKAEREFRVLVLGDSVTLGWGVEQQDTFSARLQRELAAELGRPVRVINTGVCSYNTVMEVDWLRAHGLALEPDLVMLLYVPNDVVANAAIWLPPGAEPARPQTWLDRVMSLLARSWLFRLVLHLDAAGGARSVPGSPGDPGWQASLAALSELAAETRARQIGLALFFWTGGRESDPAQRELLAALRAAAAPVPIEETAGWFADEPGGELMNSRIDPHPNARAHARMAQRMREALREQGLLPEAASPPAG